MNGSRIDLWCIWLQPRDGDRDLLAKRELQRADRLRVEGKRVQFVAAQAALRRILAGVTGTPPAAIEFAHGSHGKPSLPAAPDLGFNMTHSGDLALVATGRDLEIGVDVEHALRERPFLRLSRRYFTPREHRWLASRPESSRGRDFYSLWTVKEAYLKAVGTGLTFPPDRFCVDLEGDRPRLRSTELTGDRVERWSLRRLDVHADYAAALCHDGGPITVGQHERR